MKNLARLFYFSILISLFSLPAFAQDDVTTFEVRLPITVETKKKKKKKDRIVKGLKKSDFVIFEDGVRQEVTFFTDEKTNPAVYVGVLMDTSSSTKVSSVSRKRRRRILFIPLHGSARIKLLL